MRQASKNQEVNATKRENKKANLLVFSLLAILFFIAIATNKANKIVAGYRYKEMITNVLTK